jgi:hypothetical protein
MIEGLSNAESPALAGLLRGLIVEHGGLASDSRDSRA